MKKEDLRNGDIIVLREGELGIYLETSRVIVYQTIGMDDIDMFDDDLRNIENEPEYDIMRVYRGDWAISFLDYDDDDPIYERDETWERPSEEERNERKAAAKAKNEEQRRAAEAKMAERRKKLIFVMMQAMYGNRTGMEIDPEDIDRLILGYLSDQFSIDKERINRTIVRIPGSDNLVLIYNKLFEEEQLKEKAEVYEKRGYVMKPLATIPELDLTLYSRCLVCRMNADGTFASLEKEDFEKFIDYLAM